MIEREIDDINTYLDAYPPDVVAAALDARAQRPNAEITPGHKWRLHEGATDTIPQGHDWTELQGRIYIRSSASATSTKTRGTPEHRRLTGLSCPKCGSGTMFAEKICSGCPDAKKGHKQRIICNDCNHVTLM